VSDGDLRIRVVAALAEVAPAAWDACANPAADGARHAATPSPFCAPEVNSEPRQGSRKLIEPISEDNCYNPFVSYDFLYSLEASGSATAQTGWLPQHLIVESSDGTLLAAAPCYLKSHSRGEYVFDHGWAEAYAHAGGRYYPKLQVAVPFTPVTGRRLLTRPGTSAERARRALVAGLIELCRLRDASSVHLTFLTPAEWRFLGTEGFLQRSDHQFHWENAGFASFEDFLAMLAARKRKAIRRERREALAAGVTVHWLTGNDLNEAAWDAFFAFYMQTGSRKWGRPYLTRQFFSLVGERLRDRILLVMARRNGRFIAGALNFIGSHTLYGRYWGAIEHHPFLHFELCYYQALDFAIEKRLARVEAGAQGEHKLARGYVPTPTFSAHYIADPGLRRAIADYLKRERAYVAAAGDELAALAPFRKDLHLESR
jgi:hypothetical protein